MQVDRRQVDRLQVQVAEEVGKDRKQVADIL